MKLGIIFCAYNTKKYVEDSLAPWIKLKKNPPENLSVAIHALSVPFEKFEIDPIEDGTQEILKTFLGNGDINELTIRPPNQPIKEIEARTIALKALQKQGVDLVWQVDSDEFYTEREILSIIKFVESKPMIFLFFGSLKNFIFTENQCVDEVFAPARIHRVNGLPDGLSVGAFYDDNNLFYQVGEKQILDIQLPRMNIPKRVAWTKHLTWMNDERSKKKVMYQKARGWQCTFDWDDAQGGLIWSPRINPPETIFEV